MKSVQVQIRFALVAFSSTSENGITAFGANVTSLLILYPLLCSNLAPIGDGPQDNLFSDGHGEVIDMLTGKRVALMAAGIALCLGAVPDLALPAVHECFV